MAACLAAADELASEGIEATVWDVRVVSPPDPAMLADAAGHAVVVTAEDGARMGGAGMFLADALAQRADGAGLGAPPVTVLGVPRRYVAQGEVDDILAGLGLDGAGIAASARPPSGGARSPTPADRRRAAQPGSRSGRGPTGRHPAAETGVGLRPGWRRWPARSR